MLKTFHVSEREQKKQASVRHGRTGAEGFQGGAVVLLHPLVSVLEQQANGRRGAVKLVYLQSLDRLPVPACQPQITQREPVS